MNTEWVIAELDKFIAQTVMTNASSSSDGAVFITSRNNTAASDGDVTKQPSKPRWSRRSLNASSRAGGPTSKTPRTTAGPGIVRLRSEHARS
jgi:hypothetical protein